MAQAELVIAGKRIEPGTERTVTIPVAPLYTHTEMSMPVRVVRGKRDGPRLFVSAAIHGDEINGVEIIRRLLGLKLLGRIRGTLIAVPVVNVYGYSDRSRYLPDRRDLNRSFPGSANGSMASRIAHMFVEEIVSKATHGIDLHTGAIHRSNLPHVRVSLDQEEALELAKSFRVPLILHADLRDGSLRETGIEHGVPMLLYEAGEALRFDEHAILIGLRGVVNVMRSIGMLPKRTETQKEIRPFVSRESRWVRAPESGSLIPVKRVGEKAEQGQCLCILTDPLGEREIEVVAPVSGLIVGQSSIPLVYAGEAIYNMAILGHKQETVDRRFDRFEDNLAADIDRLYR